MKELLRLLWITYTSLRTTAVLLVLISVLLFLNVSVPQAAVLGEEAYASLLEGSGPFTRFLLDGLGLGRMATSPVFLGILTLFFLNLVAVLASRIGPTWRRVRLRARPEAQLRAWLAAETRDRRQARAEQPPEVSRVLWVLKGFGYRATQVGEGLVWGLRHRTAPLGFVLFHASFLLICAGGLAIYLTRFTATVALSEGQQLDPARLEILRRPPLGIPALPALSLESVDARAESGQPTWLEGDFRLGEGPGSRSSKSRVNHPAHWGAMSFLVQGAGLAPVLWLQDEEGFTKERVVVALSRTREPTTVPLDEGRLLVELGPVLQDGSFPAREELGELQIPLGVKRGGELVHEGKIRVGEARVVSDTDRLVLQEIRFWAGILIVSERGGGWLIAGFLAAVVGLVWRMLLYRREVLVAWEQNELVVVGRSEVFAGRFGEELGQLLRALQESSGPSEEVST